jgi:hypothetical protein
MKTIKVKGSNEIPKNFTGIVIQQKKGKFWFKEGKYHREDGPAIELINGEKYWYKNGLYHREDGPAVEWRGEYKFWYLEGIYFNEINLNNHVILNHFQGEYGLMWYKLLDKDRIFEYPDIPGLIIKE